VNFTVAGTATNTLDYVALGTTVTFAAGSSNAALDRDTSSTTHTIEADENVVLMLLPGPAIRSARSRMQLCSLLTIDIAMVTVVARTRRPLEPSDPGTFHSLPESGRPTLCVDGEFHSQRHSVPMGWITSRLGSNVMFVADRSNAIKNSERNR
jgi:hypothetical protein